MVPPLNSQGWRQGNPAGNGRWGITRSTTVDGRIVMGGSDFVYYTKDSLSSGNDKTITRKIEKDLFTTFPQLEGLKIEHAWGGTTAITVDRAPSVGLMGGMKIFITAEAMTKASPLYKPPDGSSRNS